MARILRFFSSWSAHAAFVLVTLVGAASIGCSSDATAVAEGDPAVRRKNKDDHMREKLYKNAAPDAAGKVKSGPGAKGKAAVIPDTFGP